MAEQQLREFGELNHMSGQEMLNQFARIDDLNRLRMQIEKLTDSVNNLSIQFAAYGEKQLTQFERTREVLEKLEDQSERLRDHDKYGFEISALVVKIDSTAEKMKHLEKMLNDLSEASLIIKLIRNYPKTFFITFFGIIGLGSTGIIEAIAKHTQVLGL